MNEDADENTGDFYRAHEIGSAHRVTCGKQRLTDNSAEMVML